jgi:uncharacterized protein involved in exopolysaccharide biosynthesis/Mrp family chromosome partitioning ATPase
MSENRPDSQSGGISLGDVYFILFRQKWTILTFFLLGLLGAVVLLFIVKPPQYQSESMISIRYVVEEKPLNVPSDQQTTRSLNEGSSSIINTEMAILNSVDLDEQVVRLMTPKIILAAVGGGTNAVQATALVRSGLTVEPIPDSSVIRITFQNPNRALVQPILSGIIDAYLLKQVQLHQGVGVSDDNFLTNETVRLRAELAQTDNELRKIRSATGVISVADTQKAYADQISKIRQDIFDAEADLSEHQAILEELGQTPVTKQETTNIQSAAEAPSEQIDKYRGICALIASLQYKEQNYLTVQGFTVENVLVKQVHEQIDQNEELKRGLEEKYPNLQTLNIPSSNPNIAEPAESSSINLRTESEQAMALKARIQVLNSQLNQVWAEATNFDNVTATISDLEQKKEVEQSNLKYFMNNLEEARIDEALGANKAANISIIEDPTPPAKGWSKPFKKKVIMVAVGGILGGLGLAFMIELLLDRSVKRPTDIKTKLRLPLFISIPALPRSVRRAMERNENRLRLYDAGDNGQDGAGREDPGAIMQNRQNPLCRFYEGLRDRLIVYFETRDITHKPKLVTVTSCSKGAGVSSIAAGLAASLSETGDGNVLLVNISGERGAAHQFYRGKLGCSLDEALASDKGQSTLVKANLYTDLEQTNGDMLPANLPKKISALMPKLKASEYDYIIFDMPPVSQTSVTARLSGLMDMVLLVIESEKTNQDAVKQANQLLAESKAKVSTVLNKTRNYVPRRLHQEFLDNA